MNHLFVAATSLNRCKSLGSATSAYNCVLVEKRLGRGHLTKRYILYSSIVHYHIPGQRILRIKSDTKQRGLTARVRSTTALSPYHRHQPSTSLTTTTKMTSPSESPPIATNSDGQTPTVLARAFRNIDIAGHDLPPSPTPSSPRSGKKYSLATELVYTEHSDQYNASSMPIYQVGS